MNLTDLLKRKDRSIEVKQGFAEATICSYSGHKMHAIELDPKSSLTIKNADEFSALKTFPRQPNWIVLYECNTKSINLTNAKTAELLIEIESIGKRIESEKLFYTKLSKEVPVKNVLLNWPTWASQGDGFNITITNLSDRQLFICCSYAFNPRQKITPLLEGNGIEVGPGLNPHILPTKNIDVRYIESTPAEEWLKLYNKQDHPPKAISENLWSKYIVSDAQELSVIENASLDFIFSNHVFEHLMNPIQVLENWASKLKPGAKVVGVIPDCRYTFDLRQRPSTKAEWEHEYDNFVNVIGLNKYERWCKYTAPYNTPQNLIDRNYSIHVHYYTPESFSGLVDLLVAKSIFQSAFYNTSPNNKDFGFVLQKTGLAK